MCLGLVGSACNGKNTWVGTVGNSVLKSISPLHIAHISSDIRLSLGITYIAQPYVLIKNQRQICIKQKELNVCAQ